MVGEEAAGAPGVWGPCRALAAGAIVYGCGGPQHVNRKIGSHQMGMLGLLCGFLAGYATDMLLKSLGA